MEGDISCVAPLQDRVEMYYSGRYVGCMCGSNLPIILAVRPFESQATKPSSAGEWKAGEPTPTLPFGNVQTVQARSARSLPETITEAFRTQVAWFLRISCITPSITSKALHSSEFSLMG